MAEIQQPDYSLARELAFYQAGGRQPGQYDVDKINKTAQAVGQIPEQYNAIVKEVLANKAAKLAQAPIGASFGIPDQKTAQAQQSTMVPANIYPQPNAALESGEGLPTGTEGPTQPQAQPGPAPLSPFAKMRQDFMDRNKGLSPDTPNMVVPEALKVAAFGNAKMLYANPNDFSDVSVMPDATHNYPIPQKEGLSMGSKNPMVAAVSGQEAIDQGQVRKNTKVITPFQQGINPYAEEKGREFIYSKLPSHAPTGTPDSQASQIQLAARQLKALIATPGSYQRLGLAKGDVARMVLRSAPQEEVLKSAGFTDTLVNRFNVLKQRITSDPKSVDQPEIRKELYDLANELQSSSQPIIQRSINQLKRSYAGKLPSDFDQTEAEELGNKFPDIPFSATEVSQASPKPGGVLHQDAQGNKAWMYPDGTFDEVK